MRRNTSTLLVISTTLFCCAAPTESTRSSLDSRIQSNSQPTRRERHYSSLPVSTDENMSNLDRQDLLEFYSSEYPKLWYQSKDGDRSKMASSHQTDRRPMSEGNAHLSRNMSKTIEEAIAHAKLSHKASLNRGSTVQYVKAVRVADDMRAEIEKRRKPRLLNARQHRLNDRRDEETHEFVKSLIFGHGRFDQSAKREYVEPQTGWRGDVYEPRYDSDASLKAYPSKFRSSEGNFQPMPYRQQQMYYQYNPKDGTKTEFPWRPTEISETGRYRWWGETSTVRASNTPFSGNNNSGQIIPITTFRPSMRYPNLARHTNREKDDDHSFNPMRGNKERHLPQFHEEVNQRGSDDSQDDFEAQNVSLDDAHLLKPIVSPTPVYYPQSYRKKLEALKQKEAGLMKYSLKQSTERPPMHSAEEAHNSIEEDIAPDTAPIFQDPRTHPVEIQYYSALEDEIRKSPFLTESVRLVSSDSFRDLLKANKTAKKGKNKNKGSMKLDDMTKSRDKYSSTRKRKMKNKEKARAGMKKLKKTSSGESDKKKLDPVYDETQKWQDYYRGLRSRYKSRDGDLHSRSRKYNDYPGARNPSISEGYYQNWNSVPRSFRDEPQQYDEENSKFQEDETEYFADYEESNEIDLTSKSGARLNNRFQKSSEIEYDTESNKFRNESRGKEDGYSSPPPRKPTSTLEQPAEGENNSAVVHEYHNSHLFSKLPYGYEEKRLKGDVNEETSVQVQDVGTPYARPRKFDNLQLDTKNHKEYSLEYEDYGSSPDDFYDYYKANEYYTDSYYDYPSSYYDDVSTKNDRAWDYTHPVTGLLSNVYVSRMSQLGASRKHAVEPHLSVPTIDEQYNFKSNPENLILANGGEFSSSRNEGHTTTSSAPTRSAKRTTLIPKTDDPVVVVTLHSEHHRTEDSDDEDIRTIDGHSNLDSVLLETNRREADTVTSAKPLPMPDVSTESKLISSVLARSNILRSMASSAKPEAEEPSTKPKDLKPKVKPSLREPTRRSPIPRLLWKGREIPRHPVSPKLKPEDISYGWHPIPSPYPHSALTSAKENTVVFSSMPFSNL